MPTEHFLIFKFLLHIDLDGIKHFKSIFVSLISFVNDLGRQNALIIKQKTHSNIEY